MKDRSHETVSPPPDAGGHLGAHTRPEHLEATQPVVPPHPTDGQPQAPDVHRMAGSMHKPNPKPGLTGQALTLIAMAIAAVIITALFLVF